MKPKRIDFPAGYIEEVTREDTCEGDHRYPHKIKADYVLFIGGGYEYEPSYVCKDCLGKIAIVLNQIIK